jgi:hypothetical protein
MAKQVTKEKLIVFMVGRKKGNGGESVRGLPCKVLTPQPLATVRDAHESLSGRLISAVTDAVPYLVAQKEWMIASKDKTDRSIYPAIPAHNLRAL